MAYYAYSCFFLLFFLQFFHGIRHVFVLLLIGCTRPHLLTGSYSTLRSTAINLEKLPLKIFPVLPSSICGKDAETFNCNFKIRTQSVSLIFRHAALLTLSLMSSQFTSVTIFCLGINLKSLFFQKWMFWLALLQRLHGELDGGRRHPV